MNVKFKRDMQMKTDVSWPFLSESVARFFFFNLLYQHFMKIMIRNVL